MILEDLESKCLEYFILLTFFIKFVSSSNFTKAGFFRKRKSITVILFFLKIFH